MIEYFSWDVRVARLGVLLLLLLGCKESAIPFELGERRPLDPYGIGVNGNLTSIDRPWEDARLLEAFRDLGVRHLRYPAGTLGNYWDWDTGWIDQNVADSLMIKWVVEQDLKNSPHRYTLGNLALMHEATGAVPIFMLNMLSKDLDHSLRNLRRARALGMPIRYVELGNELYFDIPFPTLRYPTPEDYGRACEEWIGALRREFPEARFAVVGSYLDRHDRQRDWTRRVLAHCPSADAVTYHKYTPSGLDGRRVRRDPQPGAEGMGNPYTATREPPADTREQQQWERRRLSDAGAYTNLLTTAREGALGYAKVHAPEGMDIWATEFNMRDDSSAVRGSWAQALLLAVYYEEFYRAPVRLTTIHNIVGPLFGLIYTEAGQTDYLLDRPRAARPYALSAAGIATSLFARSSRGADDFQPLNFPEAPALTDDREQTFPSVRGSVFTGTATTAVIVNYGPEPATVALPEALLHCEVFTYRAPLDRTVVGWDDVDSTTTYIFDGRLTLPPGSISQLTAKL